jgi:hypothetical protein
MKRHWWQEDGPHVKELLKDPLNRREAIKQGWKPPLGERFEETRQHLAAQASMPVVPLPPVAGLPGGMYGDSEAGAADKRRRAANKALEQAGILKPRQPW